MFVQQGTGTTPGYSALDDRRSNSGSLQEGVLGTSTLVTAGGVSNVGQADFMVTQRGAGANMSVDVNMPAGGFAWVQGDTVNGQGLYTVPVHASNINEVIAASDPTNPRIDQVILEIQDNVLDASGGNLARTRVLTGTPTGGATLTNRTGAVALPGSALLLADILVGAGVSTVPNSVIRDRRKWARGAYMRQVLTAGGPFTTASTTLVGITASILPRVECSGLPLTVTLLVAATTAVAVSYGLLLDGSPVDSMGTGNFGGSGGATGTEITSSYVTAPAAGSHTLQPGFLVASGTGSVAATAANPLEFIVEEKVRQNAANSNGVTSG